jgi:hypothetical protein
MPKAVTTIEDKETVPLKTCPPDGYVVLRRMTYGQFLSRREMAGQLAVSSKQRGAAPEAIMNAMGRNVTEYEFQKCIMEHNLEDENGNLLDFVKGTAVSIEILDPRIGEEISTNIARMNNFEEDLGNSENGSKE